MVLYNIISKTLIDFTILIIYKLSKRVFFILEWKILYKIAFHEKKIFNYDFFTKPFGLRFSLIKIILNFKRNMFYCIYFQLNNFHSFNFFKEPLIKRKMNF